MVRVLISSDCAGRARVPPPRPSPTRGEGAIAARHVGNLIRLHLLRGLKAKRHGGGSPSPLVGEGRGGGAARKGGFESANGAIESLHPKSPRPIQNHSQG